MNEKADELIGWLTGPECTGNADAFRYMEGHAVAPEEREEVLTAIKARIDRLNWENVDLVREKRHTEAEAIRLKQYNLAAARHWLLTHKP